MENLEKKVNELDVKLKDITIQLDLLANQIATGFEIVSKEFDSIEKKIGGTISNIGDVEKTMKEGFADVISELRKINSITRYEEILKNDLPDIKGKA